MIFVPTTNLKQYKIGIDAGSTTIKMVVLNPETLEIVYQDYVRHHTDIKGCIEKELLKVAKQLPAATFSICITGSAGIGVAERGKFPFIQEVLASGNAVRKLVDSDFTLIDLGGEDAKMVFFKHQVSPDIRMNGSCAGGTGAFIDQMASLLNITPLEMSELAMNYSQIYPIASRCGVFAKTDIQNLLSRRLPREDIAASIFQAVAVQTITSLAKGADVIYPVLCTGGPLTFMPALREAFKRVLQLDDDQLILPEHAELITARGAAMHAADDGHLSIAEIMERLASFRMAVAGNTLSPLFRNEEDYKTWDRERSVKKLIYRSFEAGENYSVFLGIDSGSTTTKVVVVDEEGAVFFRYYSSNKGNPLSTVEEALRAFLEEVKQKDCTVSFAGSAVTGYGEDLIKAALNLDYGIVETMAHFKAACYVSPDVSFILDIGGQDIKSIFVKNGAVSNLELNESCSSGCGSFLQTFAEMMNLSMEEFVHKACLAKNPSDLGTRCTVFMNSKVKEALRQQTSTGDIAAGLAISVMKNCLYKVLKIQNMSKLGDHIVVQGGTFKNHAVLKAMEQLSGKQVNMTDAPELMGAYGAALFAIDKNKGQVIPSGFKGIETLDELKNISTKDLNCKGCTNNCEVVRFTFGNKNAYYAGNKCEKVFHSTHKEDGAGANQVEEKYVETFVDIQQKTPLTIKSKELIGFPRVLNMYENYPFWNTLFYECGFETILSDESDLKLYQKGIFSVMSDNICFPAKLVHGHILNLLEKKVTRIFYPMVVMESKEQEKDTNSYNCPIVTGYPDVVRSAINPKKSGVELDAPVISFQDEKHLLQGCIMYFESLGVSKKRVQAAFIKAIEERTTRKKHFIKREKEILDLAIKEGRMLFVMTGRPYHIDPLINQKVAQLVTDLGADIISDDFFREQAAVGNDMNFVSQWSYPNKIMHAAHGIGNLPQNVQMLMINSFGCGPDSFLMDEASHILNNANKNLTVIRVDEMSSAGSIRLRLRSLIESLKLKSEVSLTFSKYKAYHEPYTEEHRDRTIVIPWFSDVLSPFLPAVFGRAGYKLENLPKSDDESVRLGLKYGHNEVCYPATLVVGDIIKFLEGHPDDMDQYVLGMTQTGGQCRATNYMSFIKNAMMAAGFDGIPLLSLNAGTSYQNEQAAFKVNWISMLPMSLKVIYYTDNLQQLNLSMLAREKHKGESEKLMKKYIELGIQNVKASKGRQLRFILEQAVAEFNQIETKDTEPVAVGLVGEIYIKYNTFAQYHIQEWIQEQGYEVVVPSLSAFLLQFFVNTKVNTDNNLNSKTFGESLLPLLYHQLNRRRKRWDRVMEKYRFYRKECTVKELAGHASDILSLTNQFGEGWLIAGEVRELSDHGVNKIVCLQPFGCIANQIIAKGVEKKIKEVCPQTSLLFLDIDSSIAKVNLENRLHFLLKG